MIDLKPPSSLPVCLPRACRALCDLTPASLRHTSALSPLLSRAADTSPAFFLPLEWNKRFCSRPSRLLVLCLRSLPPLAVHYMRTLWKDVADLLTSRGPVSPPLPIALVQVLPSSYYYLRLSCL